MRCIFFESVSANFVADCLRVKKRLYTPYDNGINRESRSILPYRSEVFNRQGIYISLVHSCLEEEVKPVFQEGVKFYQKVTCQDIVFLTTHLLTFLACSVLVIKTWILLGIMNLSHRHQRVQNMLIWTIRDKIDVPSVRKLYLIIYSQADVGRFPPRQSFVEAVLYSFYDTPDKIMHWSCCMEEHPESGGSYFQMALKLNRNKRWLSSKRFLL